MNGVNAAERRPVAYDRLLAEYRRLVCHLAAAEREAARLRRERDEAHRLAGYRLADEFTERASGDFRE